MSALKPLQLKLTDPPHRTVKDLVADGFTQRQWKREQRRQRKQELRARRKADKTGGAAYEQAATHN